VGELVQIDGSEHAWFEDRGPPCTLLGFVDDATSRLMQLRFVASESAFDYFRTTRAYLEEHGKPVAFYSDRHGIFRVNSKDAAGGDGVTQFGRALLALNIDIICANSPQAKGRIERAFGTLQDRMVKELRLAGVSSLLCTPDDISILRRHTHNREDPHYRARDGVAGALPAIGRADPGRWSGAENVADARRIWRGAPPIGEDTTDKKKMRSSFPSSPGGFGFVAAKISPIPA
jgi:hypothetical protein